MLMWTPAHRWLAHNACRALRNETAYVVPRRPHATHGHRLQSTSATPSHQQTSRRRRLNGWIIYPTTLATLLGVGFIAYHYNQPFRHTSLAVVRCSRVAEAAILGAIDYKITFAKSYESDDAQREATSQCTNAVRSVS
ncbi:uncharacterized protein B0H18DRAFT_1207128 [Fomitopsis serialis]|uniref:uncharacterized protein n=1 Tax=Fomitopsis serialis TaxID=139415 RepID=UPI002007F0AF|nr:uncharacterized protein B0H18DRAFT_1207128 [Neoantrodia serialis]KAH9935549.1 hypothetical protein B0H18DRAFT_1207128 [Neoantrodia serialis]